MGTPFSTIYESAIFKLTNYNFINMDNQVKSEILKKYLLSAIVDFRHSCDLDLTNYNLIESTFNIELTLEIIEILALGVAYHWLSSIVLNSELIKNNIHSSDYKSYSPANLLKEANELREQVKKEYKGIINTYSLRFGNIEERKT